tara:strand:+ start:1429 stop:1884 length:456 start_codon:yes stop_codon:yes gene_type:complete
MLLLVPQISHSFFPFHYKNNLIINNQKGLEKIKDICGNNCKVDNSFSEYQHIDEISNNKFQILDFFHILDNKENGVNIVKSISSLLPHVDSIGHKVLHANNEFINTILAMDTISDDLKKDIILFSIKLAQQGDDMGSVLLQYYYDLVEKCL